MRLLVPAAVATLFGTHLLLREIHWFNRPSLRARLRPHFAERTLSAGDSLLATDHGGHDVWRLVIRTWGDRLATLLGNGEGLELRLRRADSPLDADSFRLRQFGWMLAGAFAGAVLSAATDPPTLLAVALVIGSPLLAFLLLEQQLLGRSRERQRRIIVELPVFCEQLGMLMSSGYSLGASLARLSARGDGVIACDLRVVVNRVQQGLDEQRALREWAESMEVPALDRLVSVLSLDRRTSDLGRIITEEARANRADAHRALIERIERRGQQVWIPVTVATLVPGVLFLAVPFTAAMQLFTSS